MGDELRKSVFGGSSGRSGNDDHNGFGAMGAGLFVLEHFIYAAIVGAMYVPVHSQIGARAEA
ncbi:MAG: hypothetical protein ACREBC_31980 [Pyrinomonadaceae bacterium]